MAADPATLATFKEELSRLVAHFSSQQPYFTGPDYNEAKLREDFLNPFFAALGWDVGNRKGLIHTEREVDIEVRTAVSGKQKRADYVFRIARLERFTCEAKKPAETLHGGHAYQAKRDAYARSIPFAILSDFEDTRFYVVGSRPHRAEAVSVGQWKQLHYTQYLDSAAELWDLLAYANVTAGSLDRLIDALPKRATRLKARQGYLIKPDRTRSLDAEFLNFLDEARQRLGSDLLKHNDREDLLAGNRLNEAAQRILDRLVFLRICEDRGIDTGTLLSTQLRDWYHHQDERPRLKRGAFDARKTSLLPETVDEEPPTPRYAPPTEGGLYRVFVAHVRALDQRPPSYQPFFNGQLFKPHFSEELIVGDEWLANFIDDLTADDEGYNFADIKVEILGDAYERFLGKVLRPQGRGATIEEKPEVRKAGGVYYTPRYIVDYIVEQTVGRQLEGKTPGQVAKLRFLDPACGSGSFLIRVYERVMEHHLRVFTERVREFKERSALDDTPLEKLIRPYRDDYYLDAAGNVRLTTRLKRQILQNNVYGVDIDAQAVEVTQLSLYLKMLEGENRESLHQQTKDLFNKEALLPPLDQNIKCGNSLIGSDFSLDPAELVRVNAFDWDVGFEKIMNAGGFDAVVGNPPYIQLSMAEFRDDASNAYLKNHFGMSGGRINTFIFFLEQARLLTKSKGQFGYIIPNTLLTQEYYEEPRRRLTENTAINYIMQPKGQIFADAVVETVVVIATKVTPQNDHTTALGELITNASDEALNRILQAMFLENYKCSFVVPTDPALQALRDKLTKSEKKFGDALNINQAIALKHDRSACLDDKKLSSRHHEILDGRHIGRYYTGVSPSFFKFDLEKIHSCKREDIFLLPEKIFFRRVGDSLIGALDTEKKYALNTLVVISPVEKTELSIRFILGLFNSKLLNFYYQKFLKSSKKVFSEIQARQVGELPLPDLDLRKDNDKACHDRLVALVNKMVVLNPSLRDANKEGRHLVGK